MIYTLFESISIAKANIAYNVDTTILNGGVSMAALPQDVVKPRVVGSIGMSLAGCNDERGNPTSRLNTKYNIIWKE